MRFRFDATGPGGGVSSAYLDVAAPAQTSGWLVDPAAYGEVIANQAFDGPLTLRNVRSRCYVDCTFRGMVKLHGARHVAFLRPRRQGGGGSERGFRLSNEGGAADRCDDVIVEGGFIRSTPWDGVSVAGDALASGEPFHTGVRIHRVLFEDCGLAGAGGGLRHGIYPWGPVHVSGCVFKRMVGGNAVSMRGGGLVEDCFADTCDESGFAYYCNHPEGELRPGFGRAWAVRRSVACNVNTAGNGSDWCVYGKSVPTPSNLVQRVEITDCIGDRGPDPVRLHASWPTSVERAIARNVQRSTAECRALFPTNYPLLAA